MRRSLLYPLVVCIDDEPRILAALRRSFRGEAFRVATTREPRRVLDWLERRDVAVVIADQRMPRVGGLELLDEVRRRRPAARRILLTGFPDLPAHLDPASRIMERLFGKPWDAEKLRSTIREWIRGRELDVGAQEYILRTDCRGRPPREVLGDVVPVVERDDLLLRGVVVYLRNLPALAGSVTGLLGELGRRTGRAGRRVLLVDPSGRAAGVVDAPRRAADGGRRVLVVEEVPERAEFLTALMAAAGHRVEAVADVAEALRRLREDAFDRVVLDLSGKGNPWKAVERAGDRRPFVVGVSAWAGLWEDVPPFRRGEGLCLGKPWAVRDFLAAVAEPRAGEHGVY